jgi:hypothetical protein
MQTEWIIPNTQNRFPLNAAHVVYFDGVGTKLVAVIPAYNGEEPITLTMIPQGVEFAEVNDRLRMLLEEGKRVIDIKQDVIDCLKSA